MGGGKRAGEDPVSSFYPNPKPARVAPSSGGISRQFGKYRLGPMSFNHGDTQTGALYPIRGPHILHGSLGKGQLHAGPWDARRSHPPVGSSCRRRTPSSPGSFVKKMAGVGSRLAAELGTSPFGVGVLLALRKAPFSTRSMKLPALTGALYPSSTISNVPSWGVGWRRALYSMASRRTPQSIPSRMPTGPGEDNDYNGWEWLHLSPWSA